MNRQDLIRGIEKNGCILIRHGARHDWYQNPKTGRVNPSPGIARSRSLLRTTSSKN